MTNEYREWYKKHHICANCGKEKAWKNTTMCPECLEKHKIRCEKTRSEESKEQRRKYVKRKRELCIAFGICRECMKRPVVKGKLKCIECYAKEKQRNKRKSDKKVARDIRINMGLCYFCGKPVEQGYKTCKKHHRICADNLGKASRDNSNHIWRRFTKAEIDKIIFNRNRYSRNS